MEDYRNFYYALFNDITDLVQELSQNPLDQNEIIRRLNQLQTDAEERFINAAE